MLLTPRPSPTVSRLDHQDAVFLLVLTTTLVLAASRVFAAFFLAAVAAGIVLSVWLRRHHDRARNGVAGLPVSADRTPDFNLAAIHVGGDAGGLLFVVGSTAIFILSMPSLRVFLFASVVLACMLALMLAWWRGAHPAQAGRRMVTGLAT